MNERFRQLKVLSSGHEEKTTRNQQPHVYFVLGLNIVLGVTSKHVDLTHNFNDPYLQINAALGSSIIRGRLAG